MGLEPDWENEDRKPGCKNKEHLGEKDGEFSTLQEDSRLFDLIIMRITMTRSFPARPRKLLSDAATWGRQDRLEKARLIPNVRGFVGAPCRRFVAERAADVAD